MKLLALILKNAFRHKFRSLLTIIGIAMAVTAFGVLRTVITAWYAGVDAAATDRLIVRQAVSFIFPLPLAYKERIESVPGVEAVTYMNWFGGVYIDKKNFFARMAVDAEKAFDVYPEYMVAPAELETFKKERNACVIGRDLASQYNLKLGDNMTLEGDIFPGRWDFVIRGIYQPKFAHTDATQMFFQWDYLNERLLAEWPARANDVGWYVAKIGDPSQAAAISEQIDALFKNSSAETKTETENEFTRGFISASGAILSAMSFMSFTIVVIIMLVLANTMMMSARERTREYAVFKTLGFSVPQISRLILGESLVLSALGGALGLLLTFPLVAGFAAAVPKGWFPVFAVEPVTIFLLVIAVLFIAVASSLFPIRRVATTRIVDGLRFVG